MISQKEVEEMIERLHSLKQLKVAKHRTDMVTQELEKVKGELEDYKKKQDQF